MGIKKFKKKEFDNIFEEYRDRVFDISKKNAQIKHLKTNIKQLNSNLVKSKAEIKK